MNEILDNILVSASNELGKVREETEEENLVPVVKIVILVIVWHLRDWNMAQFVSSVPVMN